MRRLVLPLLLGSLALAGCGEKAKTPKVDAATEQAEALERARKGPMGTQVKAIDKAKALEADMNAKAAANLEKADPK
jgi:outer membrane murein-binding lipoprotein Lpp